MMHPQDIPESSKEQGLALVLVNECLVRVNQMRRLGLHRLRSFILQTQSAHYHKNALEGLTWWAASMLGLLVLLVAKRAPVSKSGVFVFADPRLLVFNISQLPPRHVGLHNVLRARAASHLYLSLSRRQVLRACVRAMTLRRQLSNSLDHAAAFGRVDPKILRQSGLGIPLRALDLALCIDALDGMEHVAVAGHFDIYTSLAGLMRGDNRISKLTGAQHGLMEVFPKGKMYALPLDGFHLLYVDCRPYIETHFVSNPACVFEVQERYVPNLQAHSRQHPAVGICLQNDDDATDDALINWVFDVVKAQSFDVTVFGYLHPRASKTRETTLRSAHPEMIIERHTRHSNLDVVVTRYSTLAADYMQLGVPAIFAAVDDKVCLSYTTNTLMHVVQTSVAFHAELSLLLVKTQASMISEIEQRSGLNSS